MADQEAQSEQGAVGTEFAEGDFAALLQKEFRPKSDTAKSAVERSG